MPKTSHKYPFGQAASEDELKTLEGGYEDLFFNETKFCRLSLDPDRYLIIGRRGAGKTALSNYFSFQKRIKNCQCIDVDEPAVYSGVLSEISGFAGADRATAIPQISKIWTHIIWVLIFKLHCDRSAKIRDAYNGSSYSFREKGGICTLVSSILKNLVEKVSGADPDAIQSAIDAMKRGPFEAARQESIELARHSPVIIAFDTLEQMSPSNDHLMWAMAALIHACSRFNLDHSSDGLHVKLFLPGEAYPELSTNWVLNLTKEIRNPVFLYWRPKDLLRMICWRLHTNLRRWGQQLPTGEGQIDWESHRDVHEKIWVPHFGAKIRNKQGGLEDTFPYILRHTQLMPRQMILLCNSIAACAMAKGNFPKFTESDIRKGVHKKESFLADEIFNAYSSIHRQVAKIVVALSGSDAVFLGKHLHKIAPRSASAWAKGEYSPDAFKNLLTEIGVVGRVRKHGADGTFHEADYNYSSSIPVHLQEDELCAIHPMFFNRLNIGVEKEVILPFPERIQRVSAGVRGAGWQTEKLWD